MRKGYWKIYEIDDCHTGVAARSKKEAMQYAKEVLGAKDDEIFVFQKSGKNEYMSYAIKDLPYKKSRRVETYYEGEPCVLIPLKKAMKYEIKKLKPKGPFLFCVCGI